VRHTTATALKDLGVPARDAQLILGHSTVTITQEIYQHANLEGRREALSRVEGVLLNLQAGERPYARSRQGGLRCRQIQPSKTKIVDQITSSISGRGSRTRTCDTRFWRPVLYQLSYTPLISTNHE